MSHLPLVETAMAAVFAAIFLLGGRFHLGSRAQERWASMAAGVAIAYVFVHILPELAESQAKFDEVARRHGPFKEFQVYISALVGFLFFYGMDDRLGTGATRSLPEVAQNRWGYRVRVGAYAAYAAIVSYLLFRGPKHELRSLILYGFAMAMHFLAMDHDLRGELGDLYERHGKWILAAAVLAGWAAGMVRPLPHPFMASALGFLSGAVVINSTVAELPEAQHGRFRWFALGAVAFAVVLVLA